MKLVKEKLKEDKDNKSIYNLFALLFLCCFVFSLIKSIILTINSEELTQYSLFEGYNFYYYVMFFSLFGMLYCGIKEEKLFYFWVGTVILMAIFFLVEDTSFSPIDENAHLDYINHIIQNKSLPVISYEKRNYEAVQMPLYYSVMAAVSFFVKNEEAKIIWIRFLGLLMWICTLIICKKGVKLLQDNKIITVGSYADIAIFLISFNPGELIRFTRISNEVLAVLLAVLVTYMALKILVEGYSLKWLLFGTIISILLYYTKTTGIYVIGAIWIMVLYYQRIRSLLLSVLFYAFAALPWMVRCYKLYGNFSGLKQHVEIVFPIINPDNTSVDIAYEVSRIFEKAYFSPSEVGNLGKLGLLNR